MQKRLFSVSIRNMPTRCDRLSAIIALISSGSTPTTLFVLFPMKVTSGAVIESIPGTGDANPGTCHNLKLLTTGVDIQTCKNIAIVRVVNSMTEFKQIIGRGTRVRADYGKLWFSILDYTGSATRLFADPDFDGDPIDPPTELTLGEAIPLPSESSDPAGKQSKVARWGLTK